MLKASGLPASASGARNEGSQSANGRLASRLQGTLYTAVSLSYLFTQYQSLRDTYWFECADYKRDNSPIAADAL
jgi:hypothetical protein